MDISALVPHLGKHARLGKLLSNLKAGATLEAIIPVILPASSHLPQTITLEAASYFEWCLLV